MQQDISQESWPVFKRLLAYVGDRKLGLAGGIIGMLGYAAVDTTFVYSIKALIDQGINGNDNIDRTTSCGETAFFMFACFCGFG